MVAAPRMAGWNAKNRQETLDVQWLNFRSNPLFISHIALTYLLSVQSNGAAEAHLASSCCRLPAGPEPVETRARGASYEAAPEQLRMSWGDVGSKDEPIWRALSASWDNGEPA